MLAGIAPDRDQLPPAVNELRVERHLRVVAHPLEQRGIVSGGDPSLEGRECGLIAGPVVQGAQAYVVA